MKIILLMPNFNIWFTLTNVVKMVLLLQHSGIPIDIRKNNMIFRTSKDICRHSVYLKKFVDWKSV